MTLRIQRRKLEFGFTGLVYLDDVVGPDGQLAPFESFTLHRPRRD